jgi:hypothetical protein
MPVTELPGESGHCGPNPSAMRLHVACTEHSCGALMGDIDHLVVGPTGIFLLDS